MIGPSYKVMKQMDEFKQKVEKLDEIMTRMEEIIGKIEESNKKEVPLNRKK